MPDSPSLASHSTYRKKCVNNENRSFPRTRMGLLFLKLISLSCAENVENHTHPSSLIPEGHTLLNCHIFEDTGDGRIQMSPSETLTINIYV